MTRLTLITIILLVPCTAIFAQAPATATASATIISTEESGNNFGDFSTDPRAGAIVLSYDGTRSIKAGVKLRDTDEIVEVASFNILGSSYAYSTTIQSDAIILTRNAGTETIRVSSFTMKFPGKSKPNTVNESLVISAKLNIAAFQAPGNYLSNAPFDLIVNFN